MKKSNGWYVASVPAPGYSLAEYQGWRPCMDWCVETFGGGIGISAWGPGWRFVGEGVFEFQDEKDYAWFMLRWM